MRLYSIVIMACCLIMLFALFLRLWRYHTVVRVPNGMTAKKLRIVADLMDLYDGALLRSVMAMRDNDPELRYPTQEQINRLCSMEVQDDLRRWADEIEQS